MGGNKGRRAVNLAFSVLWVAMTWANAYAAARIPGGQDTAMSSCLVCMIGMLLSRADFALYYGLGSDKSGVRKLKDARMNRYAMLASIGAAVFMVLLNFELAWNGIAPKTVFLGVCLIFLLISSYALTAVSRRSG